MQAYASVRATPAVFLVRSRFDAPSEDPDPGAGSFDKLLARHDRPSVAAGASWWCKRSNLEPWGSRTGTPWQPVIMDDIEDAIGSRTGAV